jgi:hypothetical protein
MIYLLDANIFIQAKNLHYGMDFCPAFWDWIVEKNAAGEVFSIDKVADEIAAGKDDLSDWVKQYNEIFRKTDSEVASHFSKVSTWVMSQNFEQGAINIFMQVADFYLIAHALAGNHTLVTHEVPANSPRRIKIPNVCAGLGLRFMTPYEMLRRERARFVLGRV